MKHSDYDIQEHETHFDLQSQEYLLKPIFSETALTVAARHRIPTFPTLTYLANTISANGKTVPYSTIIALPTDDGTFAELLEQHITEADGLAYVEAYQQEVERLKPEISEEHKELDEELEKIREEMDALAKTGSKLGKTEYKQRLDEIDIALTEIENARKARRDQRDPNEIVLNAWTAADLGVKIGDGINITYYRVGMDEAYITETASFLLKGILPIEGIAADRGIIPTFPGIHDTADMSEWESPFPIDYAIIRDKDEAYWDEYGATPKAFISLETGKQLWQNRFGDLTSIRMTAAPDTDIHKTRTLFETEFLKEIQPEAVGFQFLSLQADGLQASAGATDFGMLFGSLSAFIIIAVALLVGMLFRIGVEQRSREIGILQAIGYPLVKVRRRFLYEGGIIAGIGSLIGCLLAVGYAQLMIFGLQTWWLPAIGTPFMELHASPWSLLSGVLISLAVVMISIRLTVHKLGRTSAVSLLAGGTDFVDATTGKPKIGKKDIFHSCSF